MTITVNGHQMAAGCYVDSHHGQYVADVLADVAEGFGITIDPEWDPRLLRKFANDFDDAGYGDTGPVQLLWEWHAESLDKLIDLLNDYTSGGVWHLFGGEVFLGSDECEACDRNASTDDTDPCDWCWDYDYI